MVLVSAIIPSYNRFKYLLNTIESIKSQTYSNIEIIVVNDGSRQKEYYDHDWGDVNVIHLPQNSKEIYGYACAACARNKGIEISSGKYIAFCDDDDIWFPKKIECQLHHMETTGCKMSSTDGLIGNGIYDSNKRYSKYLAEHFLETVKRIHKTKGSNLLDDEFPYIWTKNFLRMHNSVITSSVLIKKEILDKINNFKNICAPREDYDCWLRALEHTDSVYIKDVCFYYDNRHGDGKNY